jgi:hypothetical protein
MNSLIETNDKTFEIQVCQRSFFFSKEQIILLSHSAFLFIAQTQKAFQIESNESFSSNDLINFFLQLSSLFENKTEIDIDIHNKFVFQYLSKILQNKSLELICSRISVDSPQIFFLNSKLFYEIPSCTLAPIDNFSIQLKNSTIQCNKIFASLISSMIFLLLKEDISIKEINFSHVDDHLLVPVFDLFKVLSFNIHQFSLDVLNQLIDFLQFDSLLYFIQSNSTDEFHSSSK